MLLVKRHLDSYNLFLVRCLLWKLFWLVFLLEELSMLRVEASMIMMTAAGTSFSSSGNSDMHHTFDLASSSWKPRPIPKGPLIIGYAHDATSGKVEEALRRGVNVICWSFVDMVAVDDSTIRNDNDNDSDNDNDDNSSGTIQSQNTTTPTIHTNLDIEAIRAIRDEPSHQDVVHIAAIGGWNGPHPPSDGATTGKEWCHKFVDFNRQHGYIFDGIDWDLEGEDDREGPRSKFTLEILDIMSDFSIEAKQGYGMIVSMAPAESYLDCRGAASSSSSSSSMDLEFSLDLNLFPRSWKDDPQDRKLIEDARFAHAGRQCYAYVLHKAGIETFDWVALQLYEAYSVFVHEVTRRHRKASDAIVQRAEQFQKGYIVSNLPTTGDNTSKTTTETAKIQIPFSKLVMGIANGWADGAKFCQVSVESLQESLDILNDRYGETYRGVMFWTIDEEGSGGIYMASSIASLQFENNPRATEEL